MCNTYTWQRACLRVFKISEKTVRVRQETQQNIKPKT